MTNEVIVVDANSPEDEGSIVRRFQEKYPNIRYIRTPERIGIYHAWNVGIREAKGKYLTNANTDDRRHPLCTEKLVQALEDNPKSVLAYCDTAITNEENKDFDEGKIIGQHDWLDHDHLNLIRRCEIGPMPVWRASLHDEIGLLTNGSLCRRLRILDACFRKASIYTCQRNSRPIPELRQ